MIAGLIRSLVGGFFGTIGFALLLHAPKKAWLPASAIGGVSFALYWFLLRIGWGEAAAIFTAALGGSLWAQWCARRMRMIAMLPASTRASRVIPSPMEAGTSTIMNFPSRHIDIAPQDSMSVARLSIGEAPLR